jgi:head-tail adaptor
MLEIGKLDIRGFLRKNTKNANSYGQFILDSQTLEPIWLRKVVKKGVLSNDADSLHNSKEVEFIIRFRTDIKLNDVISVPRFRSNQSGDQREYNIVDIEEIGRGQGLKLKTVLSSSRTQS